MKSKRLRGVTLSGKVARFICRVQWQHLHAIDLFATVLLIPDEVPPIQAKSKPKTNRFVNCIHLFMHFCILCICHRNTPELINARCSRRVYSAPVGF